MVIYVIVSTIAALAFLCVFSICILSYMGIKIPPELNTLAGGSVGSLASMLVKTSPTQAVPDPKLHGTPIPVSVQSSVQDPVHTEETKTMEEWNKEKT